MLTFAALLLPLLVAAQNEPSKAPKSATQEEKKPAPPKQTPKPAKAGGPPRLELATDKATYTIGEIIQAEVTLTNVGDKDLDVAELILEERSLSFKVTFQASGKQTKNFTFAVIKPDPHLVTRLGPQRIKLRVAKSLSGVFGVPTLATGKTTLRAVYKGVEKEIRSTSVATVTVKAQADGADKLSIAVTTSKGSFRIDLLPEAAPNNVANFLLLAHRGFFNDMNFHRVVKNQWIQSGCGYDLGYGNNLGYAVRSEAEGQDLIHDKGAVSMSGQLMNGFTGPT